MSKLTLDSVKWKIFKIKHIFETFRGTNGLQVHTGSYIKKNEFKESIIPRITVKETSNGIDSYVFSENKGFRVFKNFISVSFLGGVFYHPYEASIDMKVHALIPIDVKLNKYNAQFLINSIKNNIKYSSYGNQLSSTDLPRIQILLPIDSKGNPNWQFMEDYIKQEMKAQSQKIITYYENKLIKLGFELLDLEVEWKEFKIKDIFKFRKKISKGLANLEKDKNGINYLGATNKNNGVLEFVKDNENMRYKGNCIAFIRNGEGSMGYAVYKREDFIATQDISVGYNEKLDLYVGTFLTTIADRVRGKYNFGDKRNQNRLENEILHLPIQNDGSPHWEYMRQFMKKLEKENIEKILSYMSIYNYQKT